MTLHRIRICKCGHEEALHDGNGCAYGHDSVHGRCECERFRSRKVLGKKRADPTPQPTTAIGALKAAAEFLALAIGILEKEAPKKVEKQEKAPRHLKDRGERPMVAGNLRAGPRKILIAIAQDPKGATRAQISVLTGFKRSTRDAYLHRLRSAGHVKHDASLGCFYATNEGVRMKKKSHEVKK